MLSPYQRRAVASQRLKVLESDVVKQEQPQDAGTCAKSRRRQCQMVSSRMERYASFMQDKDPVKDVV